MDLIGNKLNVQRVAHVADVVIQRQRRLLFSGAGWRDVVAYLAPDLRANV